jgi:hypothetical protein
MAEPKAALSKIRGQGASRQATKRAARRTSRGPVEERIQEGEELVEKDRVAFDFDHEDLILTMR